MQNLIIKRLALHDNLFKVFDAPLVRARSVKHLLLLGIPFKKQILINHIRGQKSAFLLDGCRDVQIKQNKWDQNFVTRDILIEHMRKSDVNVGKDQLFTIDFLKDVNTYHTW